MNIRVGPWNLGAQRNCVSYESQTVYLSHDTCACVIKCVVCACFSMFKCAYRILSCMQLFRLFWECVAVCCRVLQCVPTTSTQKSYQKTCAYMYLHIQWLSVGSMRRVFGSLHKYARVFVCVCGHIYKCVNMYTNTHKHSYTSMHMHTNVYIYIHTYTDIHMCVRVCVCACEYEVTGI